jgi:hypothetical protein
VPPTFSFPLPSSVLTVLKRRKATGRLSMRSVLAATVGPEPPRGPP